MHLIFRELLPVYGYPYAVAMLVTKIAVTALESEGRCSSSEAILSFRQAGRCIARWTKAGILTGGDPIRGEFGEVLGGPYLRQDCEGMDFAPVVKLKTQLLFLSSVFYGAVLLAIILWVIALDAHLSRCPWASWRGGSYLQFTWNLERTPSWRLVVRVAIAWTAIQWAASLRGLLAGIGHTKVETKLVLLTSVSSSFDVVLSWLLLLLCFKSLLWPLVPVSAAKCADDRLGSVRFNRPWSRFLTQSNDRFAQKIVDALWRARCGEIAPLERLLERSADAGLIMEIFQGSTIGQEAAIRSS